MHLRQLFHILVLMPCVIGAAAILSGSWWVLVMLIGSEIYSFGWHTRQHHPKAGFANPVFRVLGFLIAVLGAVLFRLHHPHSVLHQI